MRGRTVGRSVLLLFLAGLLPAAAQARATSFNALSLQPANDPGHFLTVYGAKTLTRWNWSAGFTLDYAKEPLILVQGGQQVGTIVDHLVGGHLHGAVGVLEWFDVGLAANFALLANLDQVGETRTRFGDLRFHTKFRLLDSAIKPVGLAIVPYLDIPTGSGSSLAGNNSFAGGGHVVLETRRFDNRFSLGANLGYFARDKVTLTGGTTADDMITYGLAGNIMLVRAVDLLVELNGGSTVSEIWQSREQSPLEAIGGFRFYFGKDRRFRVTVAGGGGIISGVGSPQVRAVAGLAYTPPFAYADVSLGEPTLREAYEIYELVDKCPVDAAGYTVGRDDPRCTEIYELQTIAEACPEEGAYNPETDNPRCLQVYILRDKDSDRDGVPDFRDRCPSEPGPGETQGCPKAAKAEVVLEEGKILTQMIHFDFNAATLREDALPILKALADTIHQQPALKKISIEGHTDNVGAAGYNRTLSRDRAKAVFDYLTEKGVNPGRLGWVGHGMAVPVADNRMEEGRAANRRVEFVIKELMPGLGKALEAKPSSPQEAPVSPGGAPPSGKGPPAPPKDPLPEEGPLPMPTE